MAGVLQHALQHALMFPSFDHRAQLKGEESAIKGFFRLLASYGVTSLSN